MTPKCIGVIDLTQEEDNNEQWIVEHIVSERATLRPDRDEDGSGKQYLIKYEGFNWDQAYWCHPHHITKKEDPNLPFGKWTKLSNFEKTRRYKFLNHPVDFMALEDAEKNDLGEEFIFKFVLKEKKAQRLKRQQAKKRKRTWTMRKLLTCSDEESE